MSDQPNIFKPLVRRTKPEVIAAESELSAYEGVGRCVDCGWGHGTDITNYCICRTGLTSEQVERGRTALRRAIELSDFISANQTDGEVKVFLCVEDVGSLKKGDHAHLRCDFYHNDAGRSITAEEFELARLAWIKRYEAIADAEMQETIKRLRERKLAATKNANK